MSKSALTLFVLRKFAEHLSTAAMKSFTCCLGILLGGLGSSAKSMYLFHISSSSVKDGLSEFSSSSVTSDMFSASGVPIDSSNTSRGGVELAELGEAQSRTSSRESRPSDRDKSLSAFALLTTICSVPAGLGLRVFVFIVDSSVSGLLIELSSRSLN